eukprot:6077776-Pleurochrysis_carterae.AAC.1
MLMVKVNLNTEGVKLNQVMPGGAASHSTSSGQHSANDQCLLLLVSTVVCPMRFEEVLSFCECDV